MLAHPSFWTSIDLRGSKNGRATLAAALDKPLVQIMKLLYKCLFSYGNKMNPFGTALLYVSLKGIRQARLNSCKEASFSVLIAVLKMNILPYYPVRDETTDLTQAVVSHADPYYISPRDVRDKLFWELSMGKSKVYCSAYKCPPFLSGAHSSISR